MISRSLQKRWPLGLVLLVLTTSGYAEQSEPISEELWEEIVVTAQKREQSITDVPISMTALGEDAIDKTRARSLGDIQQLVPNFSFDSVNGFDNINVRGVGGGGRHIGFDSRAGLYIDGVYIGQTAALAQPLFDIERIEVLRGPQGHLFGRNTVSGAVSLVTRAPSEETNFSLRGVAGNHETFELYATLEGTLSDKVFGKLSAAVETREGFVKNSFDGEDLDNLDRTTVRGQLRFLPTDSLSIDLFADYSDTEKRLIVGEPQTDFFDTVTPGFPAPSRRVNFNTEPKSENEISGTSATVNYAFQNGHTLTSITGFRSSEQARSNDTDYGPNDLIFIDFFDESDQFSQEIRLASPDDQSLRYVIGLYYLNEDAESLRLATIGQDTAALVPFVIPGVFVPFAAFGLAPGGVISIDTQVETNSFAAFAAVDWDVSDRVTLNFGARFTDETKDLNYSLDGTQSGGLGIGTLLGFKNDRSESHFKPTVGVTFAITEDINLYAKYATGFKSGGFNSDFLDAASLADFTFDTEEVESYEVGVKGRVAGGRIQFDIAAFTATYDDFQILQFVDLGGGATSIQLRNAAEVESKGVEGSFSWYASDAFQIGVTIGVLDATFESFPNAAGIGVDFDGNDLPNAPELSGSLTLDYRMPIASLGGRIDWYAEYSYRDSSFTLARNDPNLDNIDERSLVNARVTYTAESEKWSLGLWARNLLDEEYIVVHARDFLGNQFVRRGDPSTWGAEFRVNL